MQETYNVPGKRNVHVQADGRCSNLVCDGIRPLTYTNSLNATVQTGLRAPHARYPGDLLRCNTLEAEGLLYQAPPRDKISDVGSEINWQTSADIICTALAART